MNFIDTNILVGATVARAPGHPAAKAALETVVAGGAVAISRQVLREYLAVLTRPQSWGAPISTAAAMTQADAVASRFVVHEDGPDVWAELRGLASRFAFAGKQVHDANIVATMLAHGERRILTYNTKDFVRFSPLIEVLAP